MTIYLFTDASFQVGHQWYSQETLWKYWARLCDSEGNGEGMRTQVVIPLLRKSLGKEWIGMLGGGRIHSKVLPRGWPAFLKSIKLGMVAEEEMDVNQM